MDTINKGTLLVKVFIVDPRAADYGGVARWADDAHWSLLFLHAGREALRTAEQLTPDLWIVNVRLPDISGFDLVEMLQPRLHGCDVFMIADKYRVEDEIRGLSLGIDMFLCKPLTTAWLRRWHPRHSRSPL
jgi:DNA-binding response OmpR family regulator